MILQIQDLEGELKELAVAINLARDNRGLSTLLVDSYLLSAAKKHTEDMAVYNYCSHTGRDGSSYIDRVLREGSEVPPSGEIICKGPGGKNRINAVIKAWIDSPGHNRILFDPANKYMGVGCHLKTNEIPGNYWLANFSYQPCGKFQKTLSYVEEPVIVED